LIFAYKLVFGLTDLNLNEFFKLRTDVGTLTSKIWKAIPKESCRGPNDKPKKTRG